MSEYIEREALKKDLISRGFYPAIVRHAIEDAPTADVGVRHGEWLISTQMVGTKPYFRGECSLCGRTVARVRKEDVKALPYCHCGAKMDGGDEG